MGYVRSHCKPHHWGCEGIYKTPGFYRDREPLEAFQTRSDTT